MKLELTNDQYDSLLILLGFAVASARKQGDYELGQRFLDLTNAIGKQSPNFRTLPDLPKPEA
jgi:hypothetical protein